MVTRNLTSLILKLSTQCYSFYNIFLTLSDTQCTIHVNVQKAHWYLSRDFHVVTTVPTLSLQMYQFKYKKMIITCNSSTTSA